MSDEEKVARLFHDTYERLAPSFGYETRQDTKDFDPESKNGKLMIAVCNEVVDKALLSQLEEIIKVVESMEQNEQIACDYGDHIDKNEILSHLEKLNIKK